MSETHWAPVVLADTIVDASVKFQFPESMTFDPMSIHVHAASEEGASMASRSIDLTLYAAGVRFAPSSPELSIAPAFDGCGELNR